MALLAAQTHGSADGLLKASPFRLDRIIAATVPTALPQQLSHLGSTKSSRTETTAEGFAASMEPSSICDLVASEYCPEDDGMMLCEPTRPTLAPEAPTVGPGEDSCSLTRSNVPVPSGLQMRLLNFQGWLDEQALRKQDLADRCAAHRRLTSM